MLCGPQCDEVNVTTSVLEQHMNRLIWLHKVIVSDIHFVHTCLPTNGASLR